MVPLSLSIQGLSQTVGISDLIDNLNAGGDIFSFLQAQGDHPKRGDIRVELTSPQGTVSVLLPNRDNDFINDEGYIPPGRSCLFTTGEKIQLVSGHLG